MIETRRGPRQLIQGAGTIVTVGRLASELSDRVLVVTDPVVAGLDGLQTAISAMRSAGVEVGVFDQARADVPFAVIEHCLATVEGFGPGALVAVGGGSVIDLAKAVATLRTHGGSIRDYYGENRVPGPVLPLIAVPTTSGTGAEVTTVAVISDPDQALKVGVSSVHLIPTFAVCDPDLTMTCPATLTAHSGIDALCHAVESFTAAERTNTPASVVEGVYVGKNDYSDELALGAVRLLADALPRAVEHGRDREARATVMRGATTAGLAFAHSGVGVPHALQYPVGSATGTPHGLGVGLFLPYVLNANRDLIRDELVELARAVGTADDGFIDWVIALNARIGIPADLRSIGVTRDQLEGFAELALTAKRLLQNDRGPGDVAHLERILEAAWHGEPGSV